MDNNTNKNRNGRYILTNCTKNVIEKISFHIASNNSYFRQGVATILNQLQEENKDITLDYSLSDGSAQSALLVSEVIKEKDNATLMVVISGPILLDILSLSTLRISRDKLIFITLDECNEKILSEIYMNHERTLSKYRASTRTGTMSSLNNREKRICYYIFHGYTPKMIGLILGINIKTVSGYRISSMRKIGCSNKINLYKTLNMYYGAYAEG
jgi:DNA-binding CsgD family transcriptional regulator